MSVSLENFYFRLSAKKVIRGLLTECFQFIWKPVKVNSDKSFVDYANGQSKKTQKSRARKVFQLSFMGQFQVAISTFKYIFYPSSP